MRVVIDIPKTLKQIADDSDFKTFSDMVWQAIMMDAIKNGTLLPKEHGDLIDRNVIWNKLKELEEYYQTEFLKKSNAIHESAMNGRLYGFTNSKFIVQEAPTIIEAEGKDI